MSASAKAKKKQTIILRRRHKTQTIPLFTTDLISLQPIPDPPPPTPTLNISTLTLSALSQCDQQDHLEHVAGGRGEHVILSDLLQVGKLGADVAVELLRRPAVVAGVDREPAEL